MEKLVPLSKESPNPFRPRPRAMTKRLTEINGIILNRIYLLPSLSI